jgi:hypothetical protein
MPSYSPELVRRMTEVLDEIIPTIPLCDATSAHIPYCNMHAQGRRTRAEELSEPVGGCVSRDRYNP